MYLQSNGPDLPDVKEGRYCIVFGSFRVQDGQKMLMILRMFEVDNMNIITTHLLRVIHTRLEAESMRKHGVWLHNCFCLTVNRFGLLTFFFSLGCENTGEKSGSRTCEFNEFYGYGYQTRWIESDTGESVSNFATSSKQYGIVKIENSGTFSTSSTSRC